MSELEIKGRVSKIGEAFRNKVEDKIELETTIKFNEKVEDEYLGSDKITIPYVEEIHKVGSKVKITITF